MSLKYNWIDRQNGVDDVDAGDINKIAHAVIDVEERLDEGGIGGSGTTFFPSVSESGIISWTNDGGLPNPTPINIKGEAGDTGPQGEIGPQGPEGPQGPQGPTGKTAYQYAIEGGYAGTEDQFAQFMGSLPEAIDGKADLPAQYTEDNIVVFDSNGNIADGGRSVDDVIALGNRTYSNVLKRTVNGNPVNINDVSPVPHALVVSSVNWTGEHDIEINVQANEYYHPEAYSDASVTLEVIDGTTLQISQMKSSGSSFAQIADQTVQSSGTYTFSCNLSQAGTVVSSRPNEIFVYVNAALRSTVKPIQGEYSYSTELNEGDAVTITFYPSVTNDATYDGYVATLSDIRLGPPAKDITMPNGGTIPSVSPHLTVKPKNSWDSWIVFGVSYQRDVNRVVEQLTNAIISLGGMI